MFNNDANEFPHRRNRNARFLLGTSIVCLSFIFGTIFEDGFNRIQQTSAAHVASLKLNESKPTETRTRLQGNWSRGPMGTSLDVISITSLEVPITGLFVRSNSKGDLFLQVRGMDGNWNFDVAKTEPVTVPTPPQPAEDWVWVENRHSEGPR